MSSRRFTPEFKAEAVRQVTQRGYSVREVAERVGDRLGHFDQVDVDIEGESEALGHVEFLLGLIESLRVATGSLKRKGRPGRPGARAASAARIAGADAIVPRCPRR